jgi:signal transduction histidine kinase/ActR/RegA family two-component response regulator
MARALETTEVLQREQLRLRHALAVGRMCALDYEVDEDRLVCTSDPGATYLAALGTLHGTLTDLLQRIHVDDRARVQGAICAALEDGDELEFEARLSGSVHGALRWLLVRASVERDASGRAVRLIGVARDNTARKEGEVLRHIQAHGERLRALGQMASGIAHDLNQKLTLISGYSDMARQELAVEQPDLPRVREAVEITAREAIAGGHAMSGLLSFVRSQELMAPAERVNVHDLLHEVARLTAPRWRDAAQVEGRPINVRVSSETDLTVSASTASLREAITNLIFNAVDALPLGGAIELRACRRERRIIIEVHDNGIGIPSEILPRIFDPFFTTKGEKGTGLGLPQVRGLVERLDGTVEVESAPRQGTTFRLSLPALNESVSPRAAQAGEHVIPPPRRSVRILIVEDEQQLARMAAIVLNQRGHHAVVANSVEQAITLLEQEAPFELIISDLGLGAGKNGWDLAELVRQRWPGTHFVLVTGWGAAIDPAEARARGVDRVIAKPYRISELRQEADDVAAGLAKQ